LHEIVSKDQGTNHFNRGEPRQIMTTVKHLKCKEVAAGRMTLMLFKHCHIWRLLASPSIAEPECKQENGVQGNPAV
jgi:hypothetical protein